MLYVRSVVLSVFMLMLLACGKDSSPAGMKHVQLSEDEIQNLLDNQVFICNSLSTSKCPDGLARLFILNRLEPNTSSLCSGFLVGSNRLITNSHCVANDEVCANTFISVFKNGGYETAKCRRVSFAQDDGKDPQTKIVDVAILELDQHLSAKPLEVINDEAQLGNFLSLWVIDHIDLFIGRITELSCRVSGRPASLELSKCAAIFGNSGSPLMNARNEVLGVLWGGTTNPSLDEETPLAVRRNLPEFSFATEAKFFIDQI
jgi:S1-C subfamily serine protease